MEVNKSDNVPHFSVDAGDKESRLEMFSKDLMGGLDVEARNMADYFHMWEFGKYANMAKRKGIKKRKNYLLKKSKALQQKAINSLVESCRKKLLASKRKRGQESNFPAPIGESTPLTTKLNSHCRIDDASNRSEADSSFHINVDTNRNDSDSTLNQKSLSTTSNFFAHFSSLRIESPQFRPLTRRSFLKTKADNMTDGLSPVPSVQSETSFKKESISESRGQSETIGDLRYESCCTSDQKVNKSSDKISTSVVEWPEVFYGFPMMRCSSSPEGNKSHLRGFDASNRTEKNPEAFKPMVPKMAQCPVCSQPCTKCCLNPEILDNLSFKCSSDDAANMSGSGPSLQRDRSWDSRLEPLEENCEYAADETNYSSSATSVKKRSIETVVKSNRHSDERSPTGRLSPARTSLIPELNMVLEEPDIDSIDGDKISELTPLEPFVLLPGKKYRRSLVIVRELGESPKVSIKGRHYSQLVEEVLRLQKGISVEEVDDESISPIQAIRKSLSIRRKSWLKQMTPPPRRRTTFVLPKYNERTSIDDTPRALKRLSNLLSSNTCTFNPSILQTLQSPLSPQSRQSLPFSSLQSSPSCSNEKSLLERTDVGKLDSPKLCTFRDLVLKICSQSEPLHFSDILPEECFTGGCKLGEGVFGEVFSINRGDQNTVLKIIPIEGNFLVNGEKQKTFEEVFSELLIAQKVNCLRFLDSQYVANGFAEVINMALIQDSYPEIMIELWKEFDEIKGSDNDCPTVFKSDQLLIAMELGNAGQALENYAFSSARQALSVFKQVVFSLAVAETCMEFEHRDLHWGNVLVGRTSEKDIRYVIRGNEYFVKSHGVKATIIDYTLSRILFENQHFIFNDIGKDPDMFTATGDYQFDVYRFMKKDLGNEWHRFEPKTNARWLHYLVDKLVNTAKYSRRTAKIHKDSIKSLKDIEGWIQTSDSAYSAAIQLSAGKS